MNKGQYFAVTSRYLPDRQRTSSSQNPSIVRFQIIRASWLYYCYNETSRTVTDLGLGDSQQWQPPFVSDEFIILEMMNKSEEQDFQVMHGEMVQVWCNSCKRLKSIFHSCFQLQPHAVSTPLCNRDTFIFIHFDHQRYEAHCKESFQV